jgi:hypothetical protein
MDTPTHPETANDRINARIVNGLLLLAIMLVVGSIVIYCLRGSVVNELIMLANSMMSGLVGYLAREYKQSPGAPSTVNTDSVGTVNVQPAVAPPTDPATP